MHTMPMCATTLPVLLRIESQLFPIAAFISLLEPHEELQLLPRVLREVPRQWHALHGRGEDARKEEGRGHLRGHARREAVHCRSIRQAGRQDGAQALPREVWPFMPHGASVAQLLPLGETIGTPQPQWIRLSLLTPAACRLSQRARRPGRPPAQASRSRCVISPS